LKLRRTHRIRSRLTLWYSILLAAELIIFTGVASAIHFWQLNDQLYDSEVQDIETAEGLLYFAPDGHLEMQERYHNRRESLLLLDRLMEVLSSDGSVVYRNRLLGERDLGGEPFPEEGKKSYNPRRIRLADGTRVLLISHQHSIDGKPLLIRLAYSTETLRRRMMELVIVLVLAMPFALVVAGIGGLKITQSALAPLEDMARRTDEITIRRLHDRLPTENLDDELRGIANGFNRLLTRLEASFEHLRRFISDVSHQLRTPLAAIRGVGELGVQSERSREQYRDVIGSILEEVTRLTRMVESLLTMSRADAEQIELQESVFSMVDLVQETTVLLDVLAAEKNQTFSIAALTDLRVRGDRSLLRQAIVNVLDNAIKYSPTHSQIDISVSHSIDPQNTWVVLEVIDPGPGICEEDRAKVFERFYRVDERRSHEVGGMGLGLAIAKWAILVQGGQIGMKPAPTGGSNFFIKMPAVNETYARDTAGN
jgi:heavy metal sensor kinase